MEVKHMVGSCKWLAGQSTVCMSSLTVRRTCRVMPSSSGDCRRSRSLSAEWLQTVSSKAAEPLRWVRSWSESGSWSSSVCVPCLCCQACRRYWRGGTAYLHGECHTGQLHAAAGQRSCVPRVHRSWATPVPRKGLPHQPSCPGGRTPSTVRPPHICDCSGASSK